MWYVMVRHVQANIWLSEWVMGGIFQFFVGVKERNAKNRF